MALVGPTASGKSGIARRVARGSRDAPTSASRRTKAIPVELVSVDSMAVYRGMDIGTAKPSPAERAELPVHLVDLVDPSEEFTVHAFQAEGRRVLEAIGGRRHAALLVGGTGLYLRSLVDDLHFPGRFPAVAAELEDVVDAAGPAGSQGEASALARLHARLATLDPTAAARIAPTNRRRLLRALEVTLGSGRPFSSFGPGLERYPPTGVALVGVDRSPDELDCRIADRFAYLMDGGLLDEVKTLASAPGGLSRTARQALGYRELLGHVEKGVPLEEAVEEAIRRTRVFARRQRAWFRRDPRIVWLDPDDDPVGSIAAFFEDLPREHAAVGDCSSTR